MSTARRWAIPRTARPELFNERDGRTRYRIRWLNHEGKRRAEFHDSYALAERALRERQTEVDDIKRGLRKAAPVDRTFGDLADYWLTHRASEKRSKADDESIIRKHLRPAFGAFMVRAIGVQHIDVYKRERSALAAKTVRNHPTLLGSALGLAKELGWLVEVPTSKPQANPDDETDQPWLNSPHDVARVLAAARALALPDDAQSEVPAAMYTMAVYTGMRAGELAGLRWDDVDLERRTIYVRCSYDGKTKTRASRRHVPIMDVLLPTLRAWKLRCPHTEGDIVLPNAAGRMHN